MGGKRDLLKKILVVLIIAGMVFASLATAVIYVYAEPESSEASASGSGEETGSGSDTEAEEEKTDEDDSAARPEIIAGSAIVYCENTGEIIYSKNEDSRMKPYSITKLLTALLAVQNLPMDQMVTVSAAAAGQGGSRMELKEGEQISVKDLLYGTLVVSGNDAAYALAEAVSGSAADFVKLMNKTAANIGCEDTHFSNPSGLSNDIKKHYTTADDFLKIAKLAFSDETVRTIAGTEKYTVKATNKSEERKLEEHTELISKASSGIVAAKTGFWDEANCSIAALYDKDGLRLIIILMGDTMDERTDDVLALTKYAERTIQGITVVKNGEVAGNVRVHHGAKTKIEAFAALGGVAYLPAGASESLITTEAVMKDDVEAPVEKGDVVGTYRIYVADELVNEVDLIAGEDVKTGWLPSYLGISNTTTAIGGAVIGVLLILFIWIKVHNVRVRRAKKRLHRQMVMEMAMEELRREQEKKERGWRY
ncbi:MAG TPA: D-alanyl-D-alanine carboxypeptidase [Candidatus Avanaerovorax faecigallinarum]|nr:D-alanyl-D-alanine carboxypeptidase [Candidatus Avanaerovorax faecigallinarum]